MKRLVTKFVYKNNKYIGLLLMALIVNILSFPEVGLDFNIGIDPPLKWLYNNLFSNNLALGKDIIFPHGPLAFFMYPLADNIILSVIVTILLQMVFVLQLFHLFVEEKWQNWLLTALLAWIIFSISNFNQLILSNITVAYLLFLRNGKQLPKYWGLVLTAFAFYVKAYVAIIAGTLTFSLLAINLFRNKQYKQTIVDTVILLGTMLLIWVLLYGKLSGFINYCIGMVHLAGDNSAAAAFHPDNNWWLVIPFLLIVGLISFLQKTKEGKTFGLLFVLAFFAAWKYGMAREDYAHVRAFLFFTIVSLLLFLVYNRKNLIVNIIVISTGVALFSANMKNTVITQPFTINYSGIENFIMFVSSYQSMKETSAVQNLKNISVNRLSEVVRKQIGNASADIYPWDYTIVVANQLNWKPRPVIQSYAAYNSWLDKKNADHFKNNAPEYFIFRVNNVTTDINGYQLESIDNRYLLNDEPQTIIELIRNYEPIYSDEDFLVYQKRSQSLHIRSIQTKLLSGKWNDWISVPGQANKLIRIKLNLDRNFLGKVKSFLYKDELYYMNFKTSDGNILKYRIAPGNAVDGIWVSPFYTNTGNYSPPKTITEVLVTCSDKKKVKSTFSYQWEYFDADEKTLNTFFGKDTIINPEIYVNEGFSMDGTNQKWNNFDIRKVIVEPTGQQKFYRIEPDSHSPSLQLNIDSLLKLPARISVDCWIKTDKYAHSNVAIETENASGEKNWNGTNINQQIVDQEEISHIFSYLDLKLPVSKVTVYIWDNGKKPVSIYSMTVKITKNN